VRSCQLQFVVSRCVDNLETAAAAERHFEPPSAKIDHELGAAWSVLADSLCTNVFPQRTSVCGLHIFNSVDNICVGERAKIDLDHYPLKLRPKDRLNRAALVSPSRAQDQPALNRIFLNVLLLLRPAKLEDVDWYLYNLYGFNT
jgi:hypothetical protein